MHRLRSITNQKRTIIATDLPFWRASTGAEQRIRALVNCLARQELQLLLFFVAGNNVNEIRKEIQHCPELELPNLVIEVHASSDPPAEPDTAKTLRLGDFNQPWAASKFAQTVDQFQPDSIIIEFVKLAFLIDSFDKPTKSIQTIIDTHDMLHKRYQDFKERGEPHWIAIDAAEEAEVLNRFDIVIAIQPLEAKQMASMAPSAKVILCKHACFPNGAHPNVADFQSRNTEQKIRFGILASNNPANRNAITNFINDIWLPYYQAAEHIQLTVAGSVCTGLKLDRATAKNIFWAPELNSADRFYRNIDVVVNPIEFGAGLKIKNVEAIAHGKPLITTSHGANGFIDTPHASVLVVDEPQQWANAIDQLSAPAEIASTSQLALQLSADQFSESAVYGTLLESIL